MDRCWDGSALPDGRETPDSNRFTLSGSNARSGPLELQAVGHDHYARRRGEIKLRNAQKPHPLIHSASNRHELGRVEPNIAPAQLPTAPYALFGQGTAETRSAGIGAGRAGELGRSERENADAVSSREPASTPVGGGLPPTTGGAQPRPVDDEDDGDDVDVPIFMRR